MNAEDRRQQIRAAVRKADPNLFGLAESVIGAGGKLAHCVLKDGDEWRRVQDLFPEKSDGSTD